MRATYYFFAFVGFALAGCAAYVSVTGMAKVFAGSATTVMVIMSAIEAGKITCASLAYRLREVAPRALTAFLVAATGVTMLLTSMGIYGFLSNAYQERAGELREKEAKVKALKSEKQQFNKRIDRLETRRDQLNGRIDRTQSRVQTLSEQYSSRGWASDKEALDQAQNQLQQMRNRLSGMAQQSLALNDSLAKSNRKLTRLQTTTTEAEAKLSAVRFISELTGFPRQTIANWFILALVFVFDPVAIAIIVAVNVAAEAEGGAGIEETITEAESLEAGSSEVETSTEKAVDAGSEDAENSRAKDRLPEAGSIETRGLEAGSEDAGGSTKEAEKNAGSRSPEAESLEAGSKDAKTAMIAWLQRTPDFVLAPWPKPKSIEGSTIAGMAEDQSTDPQDYIEQERLDLGDPDNIRQEVNRLLNSVSSKDSNNRYIIRRDGGVDADPSREKQ